ncbi:hypothetical protein [Tardiphaga robiniae]|uniref:Uncharacterized protein n=1 Tax=Tardiphaga robiniae TaxID=943830 RepID=A0A7G6TUF3_9BRAD|nr:hypothetical protein [Tardiphaga robiniae]QND70385.1 hypothetical protein HB776_03350 [Tardiphaga robiniae]
MTHSSNPIAGCSSDVREKILGEHDVKAASISAAPDEAAFFGRPVIGAPSICVGSLPIEQRREVTSASAIARISEEEELALYQFDQACVFLLREDLSLLGFAFTVMETVQSFLDDCDIKSPVSLEERLDEDQRWRSLMLSIAGDPIKQKLSHAVRDMELDLARDRISWMLDGGRTY